METKRKTGRKRMPVLTVGKSDYLAIPKVLYFDKIKYGDKTYSCILIPKDGVLTAFAPDD